MMHPLILQYVGRVANTIRFPSLTLFAADDAVMEKARTLVSYFYYLAPFGAFLFFTGMWATKQNFDPIWPLWWVQQFDLSYEATYNIVRFAFVICTLIGVLAHPYRIGRLLVFFAFWQAHALESSFGGPNHQWYLWVYVAAFFVFLPNLWHQHDASRDTRRTFLLYVWAAQAIMMLMYTMAGFHKLLGTAMQYLAGEIHGFSMHAFAYQIADWIPKLQREAVLAPFIIAHPEWGWFPYLAIQFIQFFSLWVMVRMSLQKVWAVLLLVFHIGTFMVMGIEFNPLLILVIVMFFHSPFLGDQSIKRLLYDLPVVGQLLIYLPLLWEKVRGSVIRTTSRYS